MYNFIFLTTKRYKTFKNCSLSILATKKTFFFFKMCVCFTNINLSVCEIMYITMCPTNNVPGGIYLYFHTVMVAVPSPFLSS